MKTAFVFLVAFYLASICEAYHYYVEIVFKTSSPSVPIYCFGTIIRLNDDSSFLGIVETDIDIGAYPQMGPMPTVGSLFQLIHKNMATGVTIQIQLGPESDIVEWFQLDKFTLATDKYSATEKRLKISSPTLSSKLQNGQTLGPTPVKPAYTGQYNFGLKQSHWTTVRLSKNYQDDVVVNSTLSFTNYRKNPTETDCGLLRIMFDTMNESTFNALILKDIKDWIIFVPKTPKTKKPEPKEEQLRLTVKTAAIDLKKKIVNCEVYFRPTEIEFKMELSLKNDGNAEIRIVESTGSIRENLNVMNIDKPTAVGETSVWNWKLETWDDYLEHESEFTSKTFYKRTMLGDNGEWHEFDCTSKLPARVMKCTGVDKQGQEIIVATPDKFLMAQYGVPGSKTNQLP